MKTKIKVLHITPTVFSRDCIIGGGERYVQNVTRAIDMSGDVSNDITVEQRILAIGNSHEPSDDKIILVSIAAPQSSAFNAVPLGLFEIINQYDIVHIHQCLSRFGSFCLSVAKTCHKMVVGTDHGGGDDPILLFGKGVELYDHLITVSRFSESLIKPYFSGPTTVIQGPVDSKLYSFCENKEDYGLCVSRILPHKGIDRLIKVLPSDMLLIVVGEIYDRKYYQKLCEISRGKKVKFLSNVDDTDLITLYQRAQFFFQGSTHLDLFGQKHLKPELMGFAPIESLMCGTPIIVSDAGALPELVIDDSIGSVFHSEEDLINILHAIKEKNWLPLASSRLCREYAEKKFGMEQAGKKIIDIYISLL